MGTIARMLRLRHRRLAAFPALAAGLTALLLGLYDGFALRPEPLVVAHRGASGYAPENTIAAFALAERMEADYIELDVRLAKDGTPIVMHDESVDRTTDGTGLVHAFTAAELQAIHAGANCGAGCPHEPVPTLADVLDRFAGRIGLVIELKEPARYPGLEERTTALLRRYRLDGSDGRLMVQSFDWEAVRRMHRQLPLADAGVLVAAEEVPKALAELDALAAYATHLNVEHGAIDGTVVREAKERGLRLFAWTIRSIEEGRRARALGVDGVITDYPDRHG